MEADTQQEVAILNALESETKHVDDLSRSSKLPITVVTSTLAILELKGLVRLVDRMNYVRVREATAAYLPRG